MQRTNEEFQKSIRNILFQQDSLPKNIAERRQKELGYGQRQTIPTKAYQSMQKAQQDAMAPIYKKLDETGRAIQAVGKLKVLSIFSTWPVPRYHFCRSTER